MVPELAPFQTSSYLLPYLPARTPITRFVHVFSLLLGSSSVTVSNPLSQLTFSNQTSSLSVTLGSHFVRVADKDCLIVTCQYTLEVPPHSPLPPNPPGPSTFCLLGLLILDPKAFSLRYQIWIHPPRQVPPASSGLAFFSSRTSTILLFTIVLLLTRVFKVSSVSVSTPDISIISQDDLNLQTRVDLSVHTYLNQSLAEIDSK